MMAMLSVENLVSHQLSRLHEDLILVQHLETLPQIMLLAAEARRPLSSANDKIKLTHFAIATKLQELCVK